MPQINPSSISSLAQYLGSQPPQRANRYSVQFSKGKGNLPTAPTFFATMVQIPSRSVLYFPDSVNPWNPNFKVPLKQEWDDKFIVEFLVDEQFSIRAFIENWMDSLQEQWQFDKNGGSNIMNISSVQTDGKVNSRFTLYDVWPKLILPSEFNTDNPELLRMQVDFAYTYATFS
jgi:hypothetical protein